MHKLDQEIFLDQYNESDFPHFLALVTDTAVMKHVGGTKSFAEIKSLFDRNLSASNGSHTWAIRLTNKEKPYVGHAALYRSEFCKENEREILFYLSQPYWFQGYGAATGKCILEFAKMKHSIEIIWATIDQDHLASINVCQKIGMSFDRKGFDNEGEFLIHKFAINQGRLLALMFGIKHGFMLLAALFPSVLLIWIPIFGATLFGLASLPIGNFLFRRFEPIVFYFLSLSTIASASFVGSLVGLIASLQINREVFNYKILSDVLPSGIIVWYGFGPGLTPQFIEFFRFVVFMLILFVPALFYLNFRHLRWKSFSGAR